MAATRAGFCSAIVLALLLPATGTGPAMAAGFMKTGGYTSQPIGHYEFCKRNPSECRIRPRDNGPEILSKDLWNKIVSVNLSVNHRIKPMADVDIYGSDEVWDYPHGVGDCEDYVLEKRRILNDEGFSLANLLITVVRKQDGEGHAILTVRTDRGDFILDNLTDAVRPWEDTGYWFLKRQASNHTGRWVTIDGFNNPFVGSVKSVHPPRR